MSNTTWKAFIRSHMVVLAGTDFFTVEVLTWRGLVTYYVLFFIHLESRRVSLAGITRHPDEVWMAANGPQRDRRQLGKSGATAIRIARSRQQVLRIVPFDPDIGRDQADKIACAQPEFERLR
jgi:hypothetical protein